MVSLRTPRNFFALCVLRFPLSIPARTLPLYQNPDALIIPARGK